MMTRLLIYAIAFWTGFSVMAVEMLSGKLLAPYFGSGIYVWGAIITIFMMALSLGYLLGGRWSLHHPNIRKLAAILCVAAVLNLPIVFFSESVMNWLFDNVTDPRYGSLLASTLLFFMPTAVAGMASPYAVRLLTNQHQMSGNTAGVLYFVSTLGSALGTILASFHLVLWFELDQVFLGLTAISLTLGLPVALKGDPNDAK